MNYEEALLSERYRDAQSQWPTLDEAWACLDCRLMFKRPENARCPYCSGQGIFNIGGILNREWFPIQGCYRSCKDGSHVSGTIPWRIGIEAWNVYADRYGKLQSLEAIAARGGFSHEEMDGFGIKDWRGSFVPASVNAERAN